MLLMTDALRKTLHSAVREDEAIDDDEKVVVIQAIDSLGDGDEIPYTVSDEFPCMDEDADEPLPIVASCIEYFGVQHLATYMCDHSDEHNHTE